MFCFTERFVSMGTVDRGTAHTCGGMAFATEKLLMITLSVVRVTSWRHCCRAITLASCVKSLRRRLDGPINQLADI